MGYKPSVLFHIGYFSLMQVFTFFPSMWLPRNVKQAITVCQMQARSKSSRAAENMDTAP